MGSRRSALPLITQVLIVVLTGAAHAQDSPASTGASDEASKPAQAVQSARPQEDAIAPNSDTADLQTLSQDIQNAEALRKETSKRLEEQLEKIGGNQKESPAVVTTSARVKLPAASGAPLPICDAARVARERNSPAAANLEAQCRALQAQGGGGPSVDELATKGAIIANDDLLLAELRDTQAEGAVRRGFDIGIAAAQGQTEWGPGKLRILDSLAAAEQEGYKVATSYSLDRNRNVARVTIGMAIAEADTQIAAARKADPDARYWLGFDIATAIFGDPAQGAQGNTVTGPGSLGIRDALSAPAQRGFNASVQLHLSRGY